MMTGVIWPYIRQIPIYHCPVDIDTALYTGTHWLTSYTMNGAQATFGNKPPNGIADKTTGKVISPGLKFTQMRRPAECILLWEGFEGSFESVSFTGSFWNDGASSAWEETMTDRHYKGANVAYMDGHVDWMDDKTFYYYAKTANQTNYTGNFAPTTQTNPFYWNPFTSTGQ
jgi:prepilin-type processing-associated H-X9-DG protein